MEELSKLIGDRIRSLRKANNLSQEELAFKSSLHSTSIGRIERGEMTFSIDNLIKITNSLNVSLEEFFSVIDPKGKSENTILVEIIRLLGNQSSMQQKKILEILKLILELNDVDK
ncbi:helix-turn-helix domain-containing protein [Bacillus sp. FJAT-29814]|uniref:helix-turn-helix domain-containing protein n=1 Tax=Bacillus sp. FJAT-29814 TaxID=1729688 RepID=UPI0008343FA5|nr:helix-turn-helix transcriptional regulator [Bacillus sp. FJAT-29814]